MNSNSTPLVSIIVPCYNYALFLPDSIGSIMNQTYQNWECIVVDDGSTDNSKELLEQLSKKDSRITLIIQKNAGPTVARNNGIKLAKGEFIHFLDADDLIEKQKLEKQVAVFIKHPDADIVYGNVKYFSTENPSKLFDSLDLKSGPWMKNPVGKGEKMIKELLKGNIMETSSPLVRKSLFDKWGLMNESLLFNEDWELWARFALGNASFYYDNSEQTMVLRRSHESYSRDYFKMCIYGLKVSLILNEKVNEHMYKKIIIPKINYHKRIIDELLLEMLKVEKKKAIEFSLKVFALTNVKRYSWYSKLFNLFPYWFCLIFSKILFGVPKLKNKILYA